MNNGYLSSRPFFGLCLMEGDSALLELKQRRRPDQAYRDELGFLCFPPNIAG
jgi:hypothetical protein